MYPKISDLLNDIFGISISLPIQTYGFFIAMAFILAAIVLYFELKRKEAEGIIPVQVKTRTIGRRASAMELIISFLISFTVFYKIGGIVLDYSEFTENPQDYLFSMKGSILVGAILAGLYTFLVFWQKERRKLTNPKEVREIIRPKQLTGIILLVAAVAGIAGAKIFDVFEHIDDLISDPIGTLFSFSGLAFYGGLIVATITVAFYAERNKIRWPIIGDTVSPGLLLGYGTGRIGCQLSGDGCWGIVNPYPKPDWLGFLPDWIWSFTYPHNVIDEGIRISNCTGEHCFILDQPVFPTPFYETTLVYLMFVILWIFRKKILIPGYMFSIYFILNGFERFFIEKIRVNIRYDLLGLKVTQAEVIAVFLILLGIAGLIYFRKNKTKYLITE